MDRDELTLRSRRFGGRVMALVDALPDTRGGNAIANQLVRSGLSVGANYRAARRARSRKEFIAKLGIVVEEADESAHWLQVIMDNNVLAMNLVAPLHDEALALTKIFAAMRRTAKDNNASAG